MNATKPAPNPPAAPPPFSLITSLFNDFLIILLRCFRLSSSVLIILGVAPFCGAKIYDAPDLPHNELLTSHATIIFILFKIGFISFISIVAIFFSMPPDPYSVIFLPLLSKKHAPIACAMPTPPSFVAEPPIPIIIFFAPRFAASIISSPVPNVVVFIGFLFLSLRSGNPDASAISITAVLPSDNKPYRAETVFPSGPITRLRINLPPTPSINDWTVPSPPSAIGTLMQLALGKTRLIPFSKATATSKEVKFPLNESGARIIFTDMPSEQLYFRKI